MMLITGTTGPIGHRVLHDLLARHQRVRALLRDSSKTDPTLRGKVEYVVGDLTRPETLKKAMKGVDKAFLVVPNSTDPAALKRPFLQAANDAKVQHVVTVSVIGADADSPVRLLRAHGEADEELKRSGLDYTILRSHWFMHNLTRSAPAIQAGVLEGALGDGRVGMVHKGDVGDVAAKVLTTKGHRDLVYDLTGPQALSLGDAAATFSRLLGHTVRYEDLEPRHLVGNLVQVGLPRDLAEGFVELSAYWSGGRGDKVTRTVENILDRSPRRFDEFVKENRALFVRPEMTAAH